MTAAPLPPTPQSSVRLHARVTYPEAGEVMDIDVAYLWVKFDRVGAHNTHHFYGWHGYARDRPSKLGFVTDGRQGRAKRSRSDA